MKRRGQAGTALEFELSFTRAISRHIHTAHAGERRIVEPSGNARSGVPAAAAC
jgi:hypothetical protein